MTSANTAAPRGGSARTIARVQEFRGLKKFGSAESHGFCRKSVKNLLKTGLNRLILLVFIGFQQKRLVF
jgi:hypothetical protein